MREFITNTMTLIYGLLLAALFIIVAPFALLFFAVCYAFGFVDQASKNYRRRYREWRARGITTELHRQWNEGRKAGKFRFDSEDEVDPGFFAAVQKVKPDFSWLEDPASDIAITESSDGSIQVVCKCRWRTSEPNMQEATKTADAHRRSQHETHLQGFQPGRF